MPDGGIPPLRVKDVSGSPNIIPVFQVTISGGTVINNGGGKITLQMGTGATGAAGPSGGMAIGSSVVLGASGAVLFVDSSLNLGQNPSNFWWDNGLVRLGVGNSTPAMSLDVTGSGRTTSVFVLGVQATSAGHAVRADRTLSTTYPIAGGGNFTADRTVTADTAFLVTSNRTINTTYPVAGGGNLSADRTVTLDTAFLVNTGETLSTLYPIAGGGNLSANRTFSVDTAFLVTSARTVSAGSGLSGGGTLGADVTFSVNTNVRDKLFGFFAAGTITTVMSAANARIYLPFNMELRDVRLAMATTPVGQSVLVNLYNFATPVSAGSAFFLAANRPQVVAGTSVGSAGTLANTVMFAGSWLGFSVDQVGTTSTGQDLTITIIARTS